MKKLAILVVSMCTAGTLTGQDLLSGLDSGKVFTDYTVATFKATRVINFHSVETLAKGTLEVRIAHRFGSFSSGSTNLWGLDGPATIQLRMDYAPVDGLNIGLGRSSDQKVIDAFIKYKILRQRTDGSMPVTLTGIASANVTTMPNSSTLDKYEYFSSRMSYFASLMIARKFNSRFSLQVSPAYTHFNIVDNLTDKNDLFSVIGSMRYKITKRAALTVEYARRITQTSADNTLYHDVLGIGFDIDTGGHIFQILVTNGSAINDARTLAYTTTGIKNGMMLGFNISRVFTVVGKR